MRRNLRLVPALIVLLAACSQNVAARDPARDPAGGGKASGAPTTAARGTAGTTHPQSGLALVPVTVTTTRGRHRFTTELARTVQDQARGLMFRTRLGPDEAMLFPSAAPEPRSFWMKNTVIPLDLVFVGPDHRILNVAAMAEPYSLDPIPSAGPAIAVLEIAGGRAAELDIGPGDRVEW